MRLFPKFGLGKNNDSPLNPDTTMRNFNFDDSIRFGKDDFKLGNSKNNKNDPASGGNFHGGNGNDGGRNNGGTFGENNANFEPDMPPHNHLVYRRNRMNRNENTNNNRSRAHQKPERAKNELDVYVPE